MAPNKKILKPKKNNLIKQKQKQKHNTNNIIIHIDQSKRTNPRQPSASKPPLQIPIAIPPVNYHPLQFQQHALPHPPQPTPPVAQPIVQHIHQPQQQPQGEPQITRNEYNDFMNSFTNRMNNLNNKMDNYFNTDTQSNNSFESVLNNSYQNNSPTPKYKKPNIIIVDDTPKQQQPDTPIDTSYSYVRKPNKISIKPLTNNDTFKTPKIIDESKFGSLLLEQHKEPNLIREALENQTIDTPANVKAFEEPLNDQVVKDIFDIVTEHKIPKPNDIIERILSRKNVYEENINPLTGQIYASYSNMKRSLKAFLNNTNNPLKELEIVRVYLNKLDAVDKERKNKALETARETKIYRKEKQKEDTKRAEEYVEMMKEDTAAHQLRDEEKAIKKADEFRKAKDKLKADKLNLISTIKKYNTINFIETFIDKDTTKNTILSKCPFCNYKATGENITQSLITHINNQHSISKITPNETLEKDDGGQFVISRKRKKRYVYPDNKLKLIDDKIKDINVKKMTKVEALEIARAAKKNNKKIIKK